MKAILIIDMPVTCRECPCFYDYLHCNAKIGLNVLGDERPKGCPLKPLPAKIDRYPCGVYYEGYGDGWDDCIDKILGDENADKKEE